MNSIKTDGGIFKVQNQLTVAKSIEKIFAGCDETFFNKI